MLRALLVKCTPLARMASRGGLYVSLLAMVTLAACGAASGTTNNTPTATVAPAATATTAAPTATSNPPAATVKIVGASFSSFGLTWTDRYEANGCANFKTVFPAPFLTGRTPAGTMFPPGPSAVGPEF